VALDKSLAEMNVCYLETIGRVTGRPHVVEIWFAVDAARHRLYMLAGGRDQADWARNVRRDGRVRVRFGDRSLAGVARWIEGEEDEQHARELLATKYQGWRPGKRLTTWARNSLPVAVDLES
jgi:deazaflavin-dependent oxidoreductase (nitroreductase family)